MKLKYILFDLDGTLTDPALGITNCVNYALSFFGKQHEDTSELNCYIGPPLYSSLMRFDGLNEEEAQFALKKYRELFREKGIFENEVYPDIPFILNELFIRGYKLILATSKPEEFAEIILKHFNIKKFFTFIGGNNLKEERPEKAMVINYVIKNYPDICPENTLMVGDRRYDTEGARDFGIDTLGVLYGYGSEEEHLAAKTPYLAKTPFDILKIIEKL